MRSWINAAPVHPVALVRQDKRVADQGCGVPGATDGEMSDLSNEATFFANVNPTVSKINDNPATVAGNVISGRQRNSDHAGERNQKFNQTENSPAGSTGNILAHVVHRLSHLCDDSSLRRSAFF